MSQLEKKYPVSTVTVQNKVTECFKSMSVDEKRLLIIASPIARNINATEQDQILISAHEFAQECGIKANSAYKQIEIASKKLIDRSFSYENERGKKVYSNWVIDATYEDAGVNLRFTSVVLVMLKILDKHNPYTKYKKEIVLRLKKDYAIDFYHLAKKYQKIGKFNMSIDKIFTEFGLSNSYRDLSNFKRRVLKNPIDEINEYTDIDLSYKPIKEGRNVVAYEFTVKEKATDSKRDTKTIDFKRDPNTPDFFVKMTDAQRHLFANKMSEMPEMSRYSQGTESYQQFAIRIADMLLEPEKFRELYQCLEKAGFQA